MKAAIVTGASSGIGFEISRVLLEKGFKVYGFGRDFSKISYEHQNFNKIVCDLMNIEVLCDKVKEIGKKKKSIYS
ncbi:SDR family NAD(P)-dependent oxidoreductase [Caloramator sp. mosi_1]|uniref:SDR family NAD(P)-dependent oxidoreductase n=1 Tax=Caloramator sp. mosi_1 TaxID=3023090 RepID=UPI0030814AA0